MKLGVLIDTRRDLLLPWAVVEADRAAEEDMGRLGLKGELA